MATIGQQQCRRKGTGARVKKDDELPADGDACETAILSNFMLSEAASDVAETVFDNSQPMFKGSSLRGLSENAKRALAEKMHLRSFEPGELILEQGQLGPGLFIVEDGQFEVRMAKNGCNEAIDFSGVGEILGEMSLLTGVPCTANVISVGHTRALMLSREDFEILKASYPEIEIALSQLVSDRLGSRATDALCGKRIGDCTLRRCINRGGMGVVYEAVDSSGRTVALKMLRHRFVHESTTIDRFIREGKLLTELSHPNIVSVTNCFVAFNTRFLTMDYWEGCDLASILRHHGAMDEAWCRCLLGQLACGVRHAHAAGILHLDIKPANILISPDGRVALTDFGLCKLIGDAEDVDTVVGTPPYMPPEQFEKGKVCTASDWYALACTAVEMMTGQRLFQETSFREARAEKYRRTPSNSWPLWPASEELRKLICPALHADLTHRRLDLDMICEWAKPIPSLC